MQDLREKASRGLRKAGNALGIESKQTEESNAMDELSDMCPKLTYQQVRYATPIVLVCLLKNAVSPLIRSTKSYIVLVFIPSY